MKKISDYIQPFDQQLTERGLIRSRRALGYMGSIASLPAGGLIASELNQQGKPLEAVAVVGAGMASSAMSLLFAKRQAVKLDTINQLQGRHTPNPEV